MADPDMGNWQYGYDNGGNLTSQRDARGLWLHMMYQPQAYSDSQQ